jgi:protein-L-isoaspartate O-methyltransferase
MIDVMQHYGMLATEEIADCLRATDRKFYCPDKAYQINSSKLEQMYGRLEAPFHCAYALALLQKHVSGGGQILHIGLESGYFTACLARLLKIVGSREGRVVRIIDNPEIMTIASNNITADDARLVKSGRVELVERLDDNTDSPFNAIYINKDLNIIPKKLLQQLTADGRLVYAVDHENNRLMMDSIRSDYFEKTFDGELLAAG